MWRIWRWIESIHSYVEKEDRSSEKFPDILNNMMRSNRKISPLRCRGSGGQIIRDLNRRGTICGGRGMGGQRFEKEGHLR